MGFLLTPASSLQISNLFEKVTCCSLAGLSSEESVSESMGYFSSYFFSCSAISLSELSEMSESWLLFFIFILDVIFIFINLEIL